MPRLRRTSSSEAGWTRRRSGRGFIYLDTDGARLSKADADRARSLVIPPAWEDVWICPHENGHLQAVGTDQAGRRQYLYHPKWRTRRDAQKFERSHNLGKALPTIRRRLKRDLSRSDMSEEKACALAVRLLDVGFFRIGSDSYTDEYGSFGLTTLERTHVRMQSVLVTFEVSAKDFRTWHGTVLAAVALAESEEAGETRTSRKRAVKAAMTEVGEQLGNTATVARNSYVDPRIIDTYESGQTIAVPGARRGARALARVEKEVLRLLG